MTQLDANDWAKRHFRRWPTLFFLENPNEGVLELWDRQSAFLPRPADWWEMQGWMYQDYRPGYTMIDRMVNQAGEAIEPGPWLIEKLYLCNRIVNPRVWEQQLETRAQMAAAERRRAKENAREIVKEHSRGLHRELVEGKSPHGGLTQVPQGAPV